jgi:hypothetical protein
MRDVGLGDVVLRFERFRELAEWERRELGPLAAVLETMGDDDPAEMLNAVYECCLEGEMYADFTSEDPRRRAKALGALKRCYITLVCRGCYEAEPLLVDLMVGLGRIEKAVRRMLLKRLFDPATSEGDVEIICDWLVETIEEKARCEKVLWKKTAARG